MTMVRHFGLHAVGRGALRFLAALAAAALAACARRCRPSARRHRRMR